MWAWLSVAWAQTAVTVCPSGCDEVLLSEAVDNGPNLAIQLLGAGPFDPFTLPVGGTVTITGDPLVRSVIEVPELATIGVLAFGKLTLVDLDVVRPGTLAGFPLINCLGLDLTLDGAVLEMNDLGIGILAGGLCIVTLDGAEVRHGAGGFGGGVALDGAMLVSRNGTQWTGNRAISGAALYANNSPVVLQGDVFTDNATLAPSGSSSDPTLDAGGSVLVSGTAISLTVTDATFVDGEAAHGGGIAVVGTVADGTAAIVDSVFQDLTARVDGGAIAFRGVTLDVSGTTFDGTSAVEGGAIAHWLGSATLTNTRFCTPSAYGVGGALQVAAGATLSADHAAFVEPYADKGAVLGVLAGGNATLLHTTVSGGDAGDGWLAYAEAASTATVERSVAGRNVSSAAAVSGPVSITSVAFDAPMVPTGGTAGVIDWLAGSLPADLVCGEELRMHPRSPFVAAAYGMFEGANTEAEWTLDGELDGSVWRYDCDDADPSVGGLLTEVCGDGIDNDCDGLVDPLRYDDDDSDGYGDPATGDCTATAGVLMGGDCDDNDATAHPSAAEQCGDGVDQDCSGSDEPCGTTSTYTTPTTTDPTPTTTGTGSTTGNTTPTPTDGPPPADGKTEVTLGGGVCGCQTGRSAAWAAWIVAAVLAGRRR